MQIRLKLISAALASGILSAPLTWADSPATGQQTRQWLELQRSNNAALGAPRPMPGEVADKVYERYLKSFTHPVPKEFERGSFGDQSK